ncbi:MAG: zinc-ribbon domain containing protein [Planctomycetota bacterium]
MARPEDFDPCELPAYQFWQCLRLDPDTAIRADTARQNFSMYPRTWYVDAEFRCSRCEEVFCFSAEEQRLWYEELGFYVDSYAKDCPACRKDTRQRKELRQRYDAGINEALQSKDTSMKIAICEVIDQLCDQEAELPSRIHENRLILAKQIEKRE